MYVRLMRTSTELPGVAAGMAAGEFAVPDPRLAAFALCDALNGLSTWFHEDGPLPLEAVAEGYVGLLVDGMLARRPPARPGVSHTLGGTHTHR